MLELLPVIATQSTTPWPKGEADCDGLAGIEVETVTLPPKAVEASNS
jgi:hypothetical protein